MNKQKEPRLYTYLRKHEKWLIDYVIIRAAQRDQKRAAYIRDLIINDLVERFASVKAWREEQEETK